MQAAIRTRLPRTLVIGADESDAFLKNNSIEAAALGELSDNAIQWLFADCKFDQRLQEALEFYVRRVQVPLAVRSSGLLEDSHRQPLAGLYATYMLPNTHPDPEVRLNPLTTAIKLVYASAYLERPRLDLEAIGHDLTEARMAVIVQEVVGSRHGRCA